MHIPINSLLPQYQDEPYLFLKQLKAKNKYALPAGDYVVSDLYPATPLDGDSVYLIMAELTRHEQIVSAKWDLQTGKAQLSLQHLQSPQALIAMGLLNDLLHQARNDSPLEERMGDVFDFYMMSLGAMIVSNEELFIETYHNLQAASKKSNLASEVLEYLDDLMQRHDMMPKALQKQKPSISRKGNIIELVNNKTPELKSAKSTTKQAKKSVLNHSLLLSIELKHAPLKITRQFQVPADLTLTQLHQVIQIVMGWHNDHLWQFMDAKRNCYINEDGNDPALANMMEQVFGMMKMQGAMEPDAQDGLSPDHYQIGELLQKPKDWLDYDYDFGDSWEHRITLNKILEGRHDIQVIKAQNACPPEDCGGVWGYAEILEVLKKKRKSRNDKEMLDWLGDGFDPTAFDIEQVNRELKQQIKV